MPFITSTSKAPSASLGVVCGKFVGADMSTYIVVNCLSVLSLFRVYGATVTDVEHVRDYPVHCSMKYIEAIGIYDPVTNELLRHVLFIFTVKQQASIVTFQAIGTSTSGAGLCEVEMVTLFSSEMDNCFYQFNAGEVDLCCCASSSMLPSTFTSFLTPFVAFGVGRGELYFFDVLTALAGTTSRTQSKPRGSGATKTRLADLFSPDLALLVEKRRGCSFLSRVPFDYSEFDVKDIAFGLDDDLSEERVAEASTSAASPQNDVSSTPCLALYVLYTDQHNKTHISQYVLPTAPAPISTVSQAPLWSFVDDAFSGGTNRIFRRGVLQSNVDATASRIAVMGGGVYVIGSQLISHIRQSLRKRVVTAQIPRALSPHEEVACVCASVTNGQLLVCYTDGRILSVRASQDHGANALLYMKSELGQLSIAVVTEQLPTCPTAICALSSDVCVVSSRFDNALVFDVNTRRCHTLVDNCGPVMEMCVVADGPRASVVAATGVRRNGCLSRLRTAATFVEHAAVRLPNSASSVLCAGDLALVAELNGTCRLFRTPRSEDDSILELNMNCFPPTLLSSQSRVVAMDYQVEHNDYLFITEHAVVFTSMPPMSEGAASPAADNQLPCVTSSIHFPDTILFAAFLGGTVAVSDGSQRISVIRERRTFCTIPLEVPICALALSGVDHVLCGGWDCTIMLFSISTQRAVAQMPLPSLPRSLCCVPISAGGAVQGDDARVFVGMFDGHIAETTVSSVIERPLEGVQRSLYVMNSPVELRSLCQSHDDSELLLCLGDVPLIVILTSSGFQLTGLSIQGVVGCGVLTASAAQLRYVFLSRQTASVSFGVLGDIGKLNRTCLPVRDTVTRLKYIANWDGFVISVRKSERDEVRLVPSSQLEAPWNAEMNHTCSLSLLENERCVFIEPVVLGGDNEGDPCYSEARSTHEKVVVLVGTTFTFPDELRPRSSRIMWLDLEPSSKSAVAHTHVVPGASPALRQIGGEDISGSLQCCCVVPRYGGRIILGISGGVVLYNWNAVDSTFVAEDRCVIGMTVTRLLPIFGQHEDSATSLVVALDARYSAFYLAVDPFQGSVRVAARDSHLRGIMDGAILPDTQLCMCDDALNFLCVGRDPVEVAVEEPNVPRIARLSVRAQCHLGDLVTSLQRGSFALALMGGGECVPDPSALLKGINGPQLVYGTAHGAFGTITPVSSATYLFARSLELAVCQVGRPGGGIFEHNEYRETLSTGQERGISKNASFAAYTLSSAAARLKERQHRVKSTCDGDVLEAYLLLSQQKRAHALKYAQMRAVSWLAALQSTDDEEAFVRGSMSIDDVLPLSSIPSTLVDSTTTRCNSIFGCESLPTIPFSDKAVEQFLLNFQRIH